MRTLIFIVLVFFSFAPMALAQVCDTDNYTLAQCQSNCTGTWNSSTNTCQPSNTQLGGGNNSQTQPGGGNTGIGLTNPLGAGSNLASFVGSILDFVVRIGSIVVILMIVYVGFLFVVARGEPAKITTARTALLWTVVGALILLGAKAIAIGICQTVNALSTGGAAASCLF